MDRPTDPHGPGRTRLQGREARWIGLEALAAIEEAVKVRRRLAGANAAAYEPALAMSLNDLSNRLAEAGRRDEAERANREAAELKERARFNAR